MGGARRPRCARCRRTRRQGSIARAATARARDAGVASADRSSRPVPRVRAAPVAILTSTQDIVNRHRLLDNNWLHRLGIAACRLVPRNPKGGARMSARIQALLIVLGMIALAALNASSPWGP